MTVESSRGSNAACQCLSELYWKLILERQLNVQGCLDGSVCASRRTSHGSICSATFCAHDGTSRGDRRRVPPGSIVECINQLYTHPKNGSLRLLLR